jgi:hypothetical protein
MLTKHTCILPVGRPVHVEQQDNPTNEQLYETQQRYIDELLRIWETYKVCRCRPKVCSSHAAALTPSSLPGQDVYARNRTRELTLVD